MQRYIKTSDQLEDIECMSNLRGDDVKIPHKLPFSFYFSGNQGQHDIRVKVVLDPQRMRISKAGTMKLYDDWEYTQGPDDKHVDAKFIESIKDFFRTYLVLFCAAWDDQIDETAIQSYFQGTLQFSDLLKEFDFYTEEMDSIGDVSELEEYCRANHLVNLHGN